MTTITVAGPRGLRIPGSVLGQRDPVIVGPNEPVAVPEDYGRHLIADRFAVAVPAARPFSAKAEVKTPVKADPPKAKS